MQKVVVVVKSAIAATVYKEDATIVYLKKGRPFVCEPKQPVELSDGKIQLILKDRRK